MGKTEITSKMKKYIYAILLLPMVAMANNQKQDGFKK